MDEPTAALGPAETRAVEEVITGLRDRGFAVLIISHNLEQVFRLVDRRLGAAAGTHDRPPQAGGDDAGGGRGDDHRRDGGRARKACRGHERDDGDRAS